MNGNFGSYGDIISVEDRYTVKERDDLFHLLPANFSSNSILEVGCADGTNLRYFSRMLKVPLEKCEGVDICVSVSDKHEGVPFCHSSIESYLLNRSRKFDLILLSDVLEHIYNPWKVLADIRKILNPSGLLLISVPNFQNLNYLSSINSGDFFYQTTGLFDETHIRFFSSKVLKQYLLDSGFSLGREGWRPDRSLDVMSNDIRKALVGKESINIQVGNLILELSESSIDKYFGQQFLICASASYE